METSVIDAGGAGGIDPTEAKSQAAMRRAMMRWPKRFREINDARKKRWVEGLDIAVNVGEVAAASDDHRERLDGGNLIVSAVRTGVMMESLHQKDEHKAIDIEFGASQTQVNVTQNTIINVPPPRTIGE